MRPSPRASADLLDMKHLQQLWSHGSVGNPMVVAVREGHDHITDQELHFLAKNAILRWPQGFLRRWEQA